MLAALNLWEEPVESTVFRRRCKSWNEMRRQARSQKCIRAALDRRMKLHNTPFTVQLGRGASIQLANAIINTGDSEPTIRFGSLEFPIATVMAATVPIHGITIPGHTARSDSAEAYARRAYSVQ
ncbi:hypothetical protein M5K25_020946 [Dendrobium thyrsiflorum]|uniref:Uncharacterized protein n=1 Tax=Dendrobium thyrsiflorum TaxID=117978 RepID=A0ABD0UB99_DENTH